MKVMWSQLSIPGMLLGTGASVCDTRGTFTKVLSGDDPLLEGFAGREVFWTKSSLGVFRGLHFQLPPHATSKLVTVVQGHIRDFVVDLRVGSPTERQVMEVDLDETSGALLVPAGCGHAYEVLSDDTIVVYVQDVPFGQPESYAGIRPDSAGIVTKAKTPVINPRDLSFPTLAEFDSPFTYTP